MIESRSCGDPFTFRAANTAITPQCLIESEGCFVLV